MGTDVLHLNDDIKKNSVIVFQNIFVELHIIIIITKHLFKVHI